MTTKACAKCGRELPATTEFFHRSSRHGDGLNSRCKDCASADARVRHAADPEKYRAQERARYAADRENILARQKACRAADPDKFHAQRNAHYAANREKIRARARARFAADPEKYRAQGAARRAANPEKYRARARAWQAANPEKYRTGRRVSAEAQPARAYYNTWRAVGCLVCGEDNIPIIEAAHTDPAIKRCGPSQIRLLEDMQAELAKCRQLCRNHHRLADMALCDGHKDCTMDEVIVYLRAQFEARMAAP